MAWRDERSDAYWYADQINIPQSELDSLHDGGDWTWAQISEQLQKQYDAHINWIQYHGTVGDLYPEDHQDVPDWMGYYGKHSS